MTGGFGDDYNAHSTGIEKFLMSVTHTLLVIPLFLLWPKRNEHPAIINSIVTVILASTSYHICYSYSMCSFTVTEVHHSMDMYFSSMLTPTVLILFAFGGIGNWIEGVVISVVGVLSALFQLSDASDTLPVQMPVLVAGLVVFVSAIYARTAARDRTTIRWLYAAAMFILVGASFACYSYVGDRAGTVHSLWHILVFVAIIVYVVHGPIIVYRT